MPSNVKITLHPGAIARLSAPGGMVDRYTYGQGQAIASAAKGFAPKRTGALAASIKVEREGVNMWRVIATAPYAAAVEEGSRPHTISPSGGVLRFPTKGGTVVYSRHVNHPGTKGQHFMRKALAAVIR